MRFGALEVAKRCPRSIARPIDIWTYTDRFWGVVLALAS
jgi:hypothetical protein